MPSADVVYWMGEPQTITIAPAARPAVAAATLDALDRISNADTMLVTRIITERKSDDELCAYVYARPVKLKKAEPVSAKPSASERTEPDDGDDDQK